MKLEQNDKPLIFSNTEIADVFFTEYLSEASGDFIKVYLYILFLSKYNKEVKLNDLYKKLELPLKTVQDSLKYWEEANVITKKNTGYIINNLQEIQLHKLYNPRITSSSAQIAQTEKSKYRAKAIENINNEFFQGVMSPSWYSDIIFWFDKYSFDEQVMIALFRYCFNQSALHRNYIQVVAESWNKNKIKSFDDLDLYYQKQERINQIKNSISKKLGLSRKLTVYEQAYIEKWIIDYGFNLDIIEIALKKTTSKTNPNFDYLDKLLTDWKDRNFKTTTDVQNFLDSMKQKNKDIKDLQKKSGYNNFSQRNYDNLDDLYANLQKSQNS